MGCKVCKFGGSSLASSEQFRKVQIIVADDPDRRYIVPSALGKRSEDDRKITDLLYLCHTKVQHQEPFDDIFELICKRYLQIVDELNVTADLRQPLEKIKADIAAGASADYAASRGEYLSGMVIASLLEYPFVDPAEVIVFDKHGRFDADNTHTVISGRLGQMERAVIPGFFGAMPDAKTIKTFSRGGSDVTGALVARGASAEVYENWTDVSGLLMADPRVVDSPKVIDVLSYRELRELAYMGATVLHDEAIFPVRQADIPVNIRNTNHPQESGTMIVPDTEPIAHTAAITGIAGRKDFTVIALEKAMMNTQIGFARRLLSVLEASGISFEHIPSGIDTMSVVICDSQLKDKLEHLQQDIHHACEPDAMVVYPNMALIATVGRGMAQTPGMAAKLFSALADAKVNIRMIDQGSSEINIIIGVETSNFEKAVCAIYDAFIDE